SFVIARLLYRATQLSFFGKRKMGPPDRRGMTEYLVMGTSKSRRYGRRRRHDRQRLEQVSHLPGCGQPLQSGSNGFRLCRVLFRQLFCAMFDAQSPKEMALRRRTKRLCTAAFHGFCEGGEIHMRGKIGGSRRFEKRRILMAGDCLQRL